VTKIASLAEAAQGDQIFHFLVFPLQFFLPLKDIEKWISVLKCANFCTFYAFQVKFKFEKNLNFKIYNLFHKLFAQTLGGIQKMFTRPTLGISAVRRKTM